MHRMVKISSILTALGMIWSVSAKATLNLPLTMSANGSDGALDVTSSNRTIDLSQAVTGTWDQVGTGVGVYDSTLWAVVFKFSSINITYALGFTNHPSNAPVVFIVQGSANIAGVISLDGEGFVGANRYTIPGPGGFGGGRPGSPSNQGTAGLGPGGAAYQNSASGSYATAGYGASGPVYGNESILPLIGGSGGSGRNAGPWAGGAGGGALLIVAADKITLGGSIQAIGGPWEGEGDGQGSGGAIRLVADTLAGNGQILARSFAGYGGDGRVRLEANVFQFTAQSTPNYSLLTPLGSSTPTIWPPASAPTAKITSINNIPVTGDPSYSSVMTAGAVTINSSYLVPVVIQTTKVPSNGTVSVRVVLGNGNAYTVPASFVSGDTTSATWHATLTSLTPARVSAIQAKATLP